MKTLILTIIIGCLFLQGRNVNATKIYALKSGDWDGSGVWPEGHPIDGDSLEIPVGITIKVNKKFDITGNSIYLNILGTLEFENGVELDLPSCSKVVFAESGFLDDGVGSDKDQKITIGGIDVYSAGSSCGGNLSSTCRHFQGPKTLTACTDLPLWTQMKAVNEINLIEFRWATEIDEYTYFSLYNSIDGKTWNHINTVTGGRKDYTFKTEIKGSAYYKLVAERSENNLEFFEPVYVNFGDKEYTIDKDSKILTAKNAENIQIIDYKGNTVLEIAHNNVTLANLKEGKYIVMLKTSDKFYRDKITLR